MTEFVPNMNAFQLTETVLVASMPVSDPDMTQFDHQYDRICPQNILFVSNMTIFVPNMTIFVTNIYYCICHQYDHICPSYEGICLQYNLVCPKFDIICP